jgi:hypothetical protein
MKHRRVVDASLKPMVANGAIQPHGACDVNPCGTANRLLV